MAETIEKVATIGGALTSVFIAGEFWCSKMQELGIFSRMESEKLAVRAGAYLEAIPYQLGWALVGTSALILGAVAGNYIGRKSSKFCDIVNGRQ